MTYDDYTARAGRARGLRYDSTEAEAILDPDRMGWYQHWPVIDTAGRLTGEVCDGGDGYANVQDEAMIDRDDAIAAGWVIDEDGYAWEPTR